MKLRAGSHGPDMWPLCKKRSIAAITYPPIYNTDLTDLEPHQVDKGVRTAARSSIWLFAWEILGGDVIYIGDSIDKSIVARGYVRGRVGSRAYRYNSTDPISPLQHVQEPWRHEVPVQWDKDFIPFLYKDGAPQHTVIAFDPSWFSTETAMPIGLFDAENEERPLLNDSAYWRETEASQKHVLKLHSSLSNDFRRWIKKTFGVTAAQEEQQIDTTFSLLGKSSLVEFKICYGANTRNAIRQALGQLLEYNHYPPRKTHEFWWLVLDNVPSELDRDYVTVLREKYQLPLVLSWPNGEEFEAFPFMPAS